VGAKTFTFLVIFVKGAPAPFGSNGFAAFFAVWHNETIVGRALKGLGDFVIRIR